MTLLYHLIPRHLLARPSRTALTVIGIALGVAVAIAIHAANADVLRSFEESVLAVAGSATLQVSADEAGFDETLIATIRAHPAVVSATPMLERAGYVMTASGHRRPLTLIALDLFEIETKRMRLRTESTRETVETILKPNAVFLSRRLAAECGVDIGSPLEVVVNGRRYRLTVAGYTEPEEATGASWDGVGVMDIAAAQWLFGLVGRLDHIDITTAPNAPVEEIRDALQARLPADVRVGRPASRSQQV